jgi:hypothetical protein
MTSIGWNAVAPCGGLSVDEPGAPGPVPVTVKLRALDHAPCTKLPLTACTRQKYVPAAKPLTVSWVWPLVESRAITGAKVDEGLTCQL